MKTNRLGGGMGFVWMLAAIVAGASGCGGTSDEQRIAALCEEMCDCNGGCSDGERTDCTNGGESLRDEASAAGCSDTWNEYILCLDENMTCGPTGPDPGPCLSIAEELDTCQDLAQSPCEDLSATIQGLYEECGLAPPDLPADCTAAAQTELECKVGCQAEPSCHVLTGEDAEGKATFDACYSACDGG